MVRGSFPQLFLKKKKNHAFCAFVEWAAYKLSINKLNISEQVEQGRVQEIMQRE